MTRAASFAAGLVLAAALAGLAVADARYPAAPRADLTPGVIASTDVREVCAPGYARSQREYDTDREGYWRTVRAVLDGYGVPFADRHAYEIDHLVPLCMGGANGSLNEWPQPIAQAREKDRLEIEKCREVCHGTLPLAAAQQYFKSGQWLRDVASAQNRH